MFLGRKNQYCENDYTTKCNLQIACDPLQESSSSNQGFNLKRRTVLADNDVASDS